MPIEEAYEALKSRVRAADLRDREGILKLAGALRRCLPNDLGRLRRRGFQAIELKALVELFYVHDYFGNFTIAQEYVTSGPKLFEELERAPRLWKQSPDGQSRIRLAVAYGVGRYRDHDLDTAQRILLRTRRVLEEVPPDIFLGTRGELAYALGRVYRQHQMFVDAIKEFERAIDFYYHRVEQRKVHGKASASDEAFSRHKIAIIVGLSIGWCNLTQGRLSAAITTNLIPARALLRASNDELNAAYADVIYASACRARGSKWDSLNSLYRLVSEAQRVFKRYQHKHYTSGANIELALIELARERHNEAEACLDQYTDVAHPRWQTWANIIRSRIAGVKGDKPGAFRFAESAFKVATKRDERLGQIEALIAMSEARSHHEDALTDLLQAKELNQQAEREGKVWTSNLKIDAVCSLHMVKHHLAAGQRVRAAKCFADWQAIQHKVEHAPVRRMAETLSAELSLQTPGKFEVSGLAFHANRDRMLLHLIEEAEAQEGHPLSYSRLHDLLGVSASMIQAVRKRHPKNSQPAVAKAHA